MKNKTCRKCGHKVKKDRRWNKVVYWVYLRHKGAQVWKRIGESLSQGKGGGGAHTRADSSMRNMRNKIGR